MTHETTAVSRTVACEIGFVDGNICAFTQVGSSSKISVINVEITLVYSEIIHVDSA